MSRATLPLHLTALSYARDFVGLRELPGNRGPGVGYFQRQAGLPAGTPWCAAFVNGIIDIACAVHDVESPFEGTLREGYVQDYVDMATSRNWLVPFDRAFPGALFAVYSQSERRFAHIGFVEGVMVGMGEFWTVEGNTNDDGGREGHSVLRRKRTKATSYVFIEWVPEQEVRPWIRV